VLDQTVKWQSATIPWQDGIIELSFRFPFLLHGILSLSAVHKAVSLPLLERSDLLMQASMHIDIALREFRHRLQVPDAQSSPAMFALSSVLIIYHLALAQTQEIKDPIEGLILCFRLVIGVKVILEQPQGLEVIMNSEAAPLLATSMRYPTKGPIPDILRLYELCDEQEPHKEAIEKLHVAFLELQAAKPEQSAYALMFIWPAEIAENFVDLLASKKDAVALVILAYYAALFRLWGGGAWWLRGWHSMIMDSVKVTLADIAPGQYDEYLEWPQSYQLGS
jgi:hypothetical protein